jgi:Sulfotransferase domain
MKRALRFLYSSQAAILIYQRLRRCVFSDGKYLVLAAMPKSGSTFLSHTLCALTGYRHYYLACAYDNIEQEIYLPRVIDGFGSGRVVQQHFKANGPNLEVLNRFDIKPIVVVRNIFDLAASIRDHLVTERLDNLPAVYPPGDFLTFSPSRQLDFVIDMIVPWYITYYVSWRQAEKKKQIEFLWVVYEELVADWSAGIRRILDFLGMQKPDAAIARAIQTTRAEPKERTRLNVGVPGRASALLSDSQRERIVRLTQYYPNVDFNRIGISCSFQDDYECRHVQAR